MQYDVQRVGSISVITLNMAQDFVVVCTIAEFLTMENWSCFVLLQMEPQGFDYNHSSFQQFDYNHGGSEYSDYQVTLNPSFGSQGYNQTFAILVPVCHLLWRQGKTTLACHRKKQKRTPDHIQTMFYI